MQTFHIAPISTGSITWVGSSSKITEQLFDLILLKQIKEISAGSPDKVEDGIKTVQGVLRENPGVGVKVGDIQFTIKGK